MISSVFPLLTLVSGIITYEYKRIVNNNEPERTASNMCQLAKKNWNKVKIYLKLPFIYKPIIFIFLVVIAPGVDDAMFYFNSNVLDFDNNTFAIINVISSLGNILGVWTYRLFFS